MIHPYDAWKEEYLRKEASNAALNASIKNPCVKTFGKGPEGMKCKSCRFLIFKKFTKKYYKCSFRKITGGPGSDHRVNWDACAKFETGAC